MRHLVFAALLLTACSSSNVDSAAYASSEEAGTPAATAPDATSPDAAPVVVSHDPVLDATVTMDAGADTASDDASPDVDPTPLDAGPDSNPPIDAGVDAPPPADAGADSAWTGSCAQCKVITDDLTGVPWCYGTPASPHGGSCHFYCPPDCVPPPTQVAGSSGCGDQSWNADGTGTPNGVVSMAFCCPASPTCTF